MEVEGYLRMLGSSCEGSAGGGWMGRVVSTDILPFGSCVWEKGLKGSWLTKFRTWGSSWLGTTPPKGFLNDDNSILLFASQTLS